MGAGQTEAFKRPPGPSRCTRLVGRRFGAWFARLGLRLVNVLVHS
jgi:hypothetical protein